METPEKNRVEFTTKKLGKREDALEIIRRYKTAKGKLLERAAKLKGKDDTRSRKLYQLAANMKKGDMSTVGIRRKAAIAELDLLIDESMAGKAKKQ